MKNLQYWNNFLELKFQEIEILPKFLLKSVESAISMKSYLSSEEKTCDAECWKPVRSKLFWKVTVNKDCFCQSNLKQQKKVK